MTSTNIPKAPKELNADEAKKVAGGTLPSRPTVPTQPIAQPIAQPIKPGSGLV